MKKTGSAALLFIFFSAMLFAADVETGLDASRVPLGESTNINFSFSGVSSEIKTLSVPKLDGVNISYAGTRRSFQYINGKTWNGVVVSYSLTPERTGHFKIPAFVFEIKGEKFYSKEISISCIKPDAGSSRSAGEPGNILSSAEVSKRRVYSGEPFVLRYFMLASGLSGIEVKGLEKQPEARGFVLKKMDEMVEDSTIVRGGRELVKSHIYSYVLVPADNSHSSVGGGSVIISVEERSFFGFSVKKRLLFDSLPVEVVKLPLAGRPHDFSGLVGDFKISAGPASVNPGGSEVRIAVKVSGTGNFFAMPKPVPEGDLNGLQLMPDEKSHEVKIENETVSGEKVFIYTVISSGERKVEGIKFKLSFFNPASASYATASSEPVSFSIRSGVKEERNEGDKDAQEKFSSYLVPLTVFIFAASVSVLLYFFYGSRKYSSALTSREKEDVKPPVAEKKERLSMLELDTSYSSVDEERFFTLALKILRIHGSEISRDIMSEIDSVRYGGAKLTPERKKIIYDGLRKIVSDSNIRDV